MKYTTKSIFIDTNIIEGNNFFHGSYLQSLLHYSRIGVIKLFMTSISKMELIDRMQKRLIETRNEHNKLIKALNKPNQRILKNLSQYEEVNYSPVKIEASLKELIAKLETNIKSAGVHVIESNNVNPEEVFTLFYNCQPPFSSNEKKRYEFPDAFILKTVDNYCKKKKTKMIFLTNDNDFNGYKSRNLLFRKDLKELLAEITVYYDSLQTTQIIPFITEQLTANQKDLDSLINEKIKELIIFDTDYEKTTNLKFIGKISNYDITSIRKDYAEITCLFQLDYEFAVLPSSFDIERALFEDNLRPKKIKNKLIIPCDLEVNIHQDNDIKLKWINSNQKIRIEFY